MSLATLLPLLEILSDGEPHSGADIGACLGVTRAAVWKQIKSLEDYGLQVQASKAEGYRLASGLDLLDATRLAQRAAQLGVALQILPELASTNSHLLHAQTPHGAICMVEYQSAGRGRRGRPWFNSVAGGICLSVCMRSSAGVSALEGLSLAVGVVVAEVLERLGCERVQLKWPNDLLLDGRKLGGILIEIGGDLAGDCFAIIGLGLNVYSRLSESIEQPWVSLADVAIDVRRTTLAEALIEAMIELVNNYSDRGFAAYHQPWLTRAAFLNQTVTLSTPQGSVTGRMTGLDSSGGLVLSLQGEQQVFTGGEISLRRQP